MTEKFCKYGHVKVNGWCKVCSSIRSAARRKRVDETWNDKAPVYRELATQPWRVEA